MQTRSKRDAELLYEAKYGKRGSDGKMSREQYAALRRRVGGTAKGKCKNVVGGQFAGAVLCPVPPFFWQH